MGKKDPRVDAYIERAASFARPILRRIRRAVHAGCPQVVETIKWGHPAFDYKGSLAGMAAFQKHCTFGFWKHPLVQKKLGRMPKEQRSAWGTFGRIAHVSELPPHESLRGYVEAAAELNEQGVKMARRRTPPSRRRTLDVPEDLLEALLDNRKARDGFDELSYSHKKDYVDWITGAKRPETRKRRIETAVEWIAQGKGRNWKYERKA